MRVLGLESSCDETAAAIVVDGTTVLADVVSSQAAVHARYGGVVPELASRHHVVNVVPVLSAALRDAGLELDDIDGIAVTCGPGLVGALLVALQTAKAIAFARQIPLVGVNHLEGHLAAVYLADGDGVVTAPPFPHLALLVSGGHTSLIRVDDFGAVRELGATRDDAAGEAFDKVAKMLGLGYPGGVQIDRLAATGDPDAVAMPKLMTRRSTGYDFSFSGVKTAALNLVRAHGIPTGQALADFCASFQRTVVEVLVRKTRAAVRAEGFGHVQVCGGVAANSQLRRDLRAAGAADGFEVFVPPPRRCTDNAAMIAAAGFHRLARGERADLTLNADPSLPLPAVGTAE
jgi:N6-L-threonylcarbamoyladenine synthase